MQNLVREFDAIIWQQPAGSAVQPEHVALLDALARMGTPIYFLGDALLAASRALNEADRQRWQSLIHLKPGGTSWLNHVTIADDAELLLSKNAIAGPVARFSYPVSLQHAGLHAGLPGEIVLGRSGTFELLVATKDLKSWTRTFTHHLRLSGATDAASAAEQAKLFKNGIAWWLDHQFVFDLRAEVEPAHITAAAGETFEYRILVRWRVPTFGSLVALRQRICHWAGCHDFLRFRSSAFLPYRRPQLRCQRPILEPAGLKSQI